MHKYVKEIYEFLWRFDYFIYINYLFYYYYVIDCILVKYVISLGGDHVKLIRLVS